MATAAPRTQDRTVVASAPEPAGAAIVHVMTVSMSLRFLAGQASFMRRAGFVIHAVSSPGPELERFGKEERAVTHPVEMTRRVTPLQDLRALFQVWRVLRRVRPAIVHGHTPKGGLIAMIAGFLARTPVRVYHLRGLPLLTASGLRRWILRLTERTSCRLAHRVFALCHSLQEVAIREGLCDPQRVRVLSGGSGNGVDAEGRFHPLGPDVRRAVRVQYGIPADALVIGFVGRIVRDKGVAELADAWRELRERHAGLHLLVVGPLEQNDRLPAELMAALRADQRVHLVGLNWDTPRFYTAMDVLALPSYREGFGNVLIEAAAMALPVVATSVSGCVDAVQDGVTGTLVPPREPAALEAAIERYLSDPGLRADHGAAGRRRVLAEFRPEVIWQAIAGEYCDLLASAGAAAIKE